MEFSSVTPLRPASPHGDGGAKHLAFEARESADPTSAGGDLPVAVYQTWVTGGRVQDSSSPQVMSLVLSPAAGAALARAYIPAGASESPDVAGGDLGASFRVVLVRGDMRPVEAWDDVASTYAPLQIPQSTFSFSRGRGLAVSMEMKRKHLPPSKNHGDVFFRLLVQLRVPVLGACPVAVSAPFRIFSKQSTAAPRPEPKRRRNPAPTKPFVGPLDAASAELVGSFPVLGAFPSTDSVGSAASTVVVSATPAPKARVTRMLPPAPRRSGRAPKRSRADDEEAAAEASARAVRPPGATAVWDDAAVASVPRAGPGRGTFSFSPSGAHDDDDDTASDDEMASLGRGDSFGTDSQGHADPDEDAAILDELDDIARPGFGHFAASPVRERAAAPFALPAGAIAPVSLPKFQAKFVRCLGQGVLAHASRSRADSIPSGSPTGMDWAVLN